MTLQFRVSLQSARGVQRLLQKRRITPCSMTALFATGLTLKDFEEKLQAPCVLKHVTLSHDEFFKVAIDALAVVRKLTELTFQQCLMALQTSGDVEVVRGGHPGNKVLK